MRFTAGFFISVLESAALLAVFSCKQEASTRPTPVVEQTSSTSPVDSSNQVLTLSEAQMDSLLATPELPRPLWKLFFGFDLPDSARVQVNWLSGQLDADPELEKVVWYRLRSDGHVAVFDLKNDRWQKCDALPLDFFHGETPPTMHKKLMALQVSGYSWGSSNYSAEVVHFCRLTEHGVKSVFELLKYETACLLNDGGAFRTISGTLVSVQPERLEVNYRYLVEGDLDSKYAHRTVFDASIKIPFLWSSEKQEYLPRLPQRLAGDYGQELVNDGEAQFDPFFRPQLNEIKLHGPLWKRKALKYDTQD